MAQKFFSVITAQVALCALLATAASAQFTGVFTQHNDLSRTGQNLYETTLTPSNVMATTSGVPNFGKVFSFAVDGQIYAQPLYVPNVTIKGVKYSGVIYVATEYDSVYAFDATGATPTPLWHRSFIAVGKGVVPVPCGTDGATTDISCNVFPFYGITGTPVIDPTSNTMYLVVRTAETTSGVTTYYQRLHALNIASGSDRSGSPVVISGSVAGTGAGSSGGIVAYDPLADIQRAALTLVNGTIYIGWAGAAHGWIMAYDKKTLEQTAIFNTAPNAVLGGVWQTGNGFVVDSSDNLYVSVGDALFDVYEGGIDYGDSVLKLSPTLDLLSYFTPDDQLCRQGNDLDVGSAGPVLLPTQGGEYPNELLAIGKSGNGITGASCDGTDVYLLNQESLGGYVSGGPDNVLQELTDPDTTTAQGFWSSPAFWQGSENASGTSGTSYVYMAGTDTRNGGDHGATLDQYAINAVTGSETAQLSFVASSPNLFPQGSTPSVSSNGASDGIVWAIERYDDLALQPGSTPATLYAYNATNVSQMLYSSGTMTNLRDQPGCANKFQTPTIANGRVYVGTQTELDVYGLLGVDGNSSGEGIALSAPCFTYPSNVVVGKKSPAQEFTITNIGTATLTFTSIKILGANPGNFRLTTNQCGTSLAVGASCNIAVVFAPTVATPVTAIVTITDSAVGSPHVIGLVGTGDQPSVNVTPPYLSFGKQDIGIASPSQTVTVANSGNLVVTVSSVTITGTNANLFTETNNCTSIAVNANCTITVTFTPQVTGQFSATLNITDNAGGSPQTVSLTGVGVQPNAVLSPTQINFGMVAVGSSSSPQPVTLTNNGGGTLLISSITFTGPNPGDFSQTNNCGGSVASQGTCTINVTFTPAADGTGEAYMNVNDNSVPSPQQVSLSGDGT
jgi:Abnormal spindle-like microcephaly-assoc'd, ASPM-SPD-2-Hydin